jgi:ADP-ribosyl-[dinitrogen reductase] hydrolase
MDLRDRVVGCVLGLALGDAAGAPFEFRRAASIPDPAPLFELPWMDLPPGSTTDDTAMSRNLVRSLVERGGFDPEDVVRRHVEWFASDPPGVGTLTRRVLTRSASGEDAATAARTIWEQRGPEVSAGNGSVMYCAPLGVAYANRSRELDELAPKLSALTHFDERCRTATLAITVAVASLVRGEDRETAASRAVDAALPREGGEELQFLVEAVGRSRTIDGPDQGFCLFTAAAGLQGLLRYEAFEPAIRHVIGLGGDADTNAAITGALMGAHVGEPGLPGDWLERLQGTPEIRDEAEALVELADRDR